MTNLKIFIIIIVLGLFTTFVVQNTDAVEVYFLTFEAELSTAVLVLGVALVGFLLGFTVAKATARKRRLPARRPAAEDEARPVSGPVSEGNGAGA